MLTEEIEPRLYGVAELAVLYNPRVTPNSATRILNRWIDRSPGLRERLETLGFRRGMRSFTPLMVKLIFEALGEP